MHWYHSVSKSFKEYAFNLIYYRLGDGDANVIECILCCSVVVNLNVLL